MNITKGEILHFDKPLGWTSFNLVAKVRWLICRKAGIKKLKVGHAGTLDPLATGLLVVLVGRATRAAEFAEAETKEYVAAFRPGIVTDTQDITGNVLRSSGVLPTGEDVRNALPRFTGEIDQSPDLNRLYDALSELFFELQLRDETRLRRSVWERAGDDTLRGLFLMKLKKQFDAAGTEEQRLAIEQAARWGLAALDKREEVVKHEDQ